MAAALPLNAREPWLAPLAGYSDLPFRLLCREFGASVCCTEMVSAKGLMYHSPGTVDLLQSAAQDSPLVVQLFGNEADVMRTVLPPLLARGFCWFDLNMGCSVPKVTRTGCGAAMLKDVDNALVVARAMIDVAGRGHVGFKLRLGWDRGQEVWRGLALGLQEAGAGWITLHPRYARQGFGGEADWRILQELQTILDIPVLGSGDMLTAEAGVRCLSSTGVAGIMYARGAMQNPAIFDAHKELLQGGAVRLPSPEELLGVVRRHAVLAREYSVERVALFKMRTFVPRYVHHLPGVRVLRQGLASCRDWQTLDHILEDFLLSANDTY